MKEIMAQESSEHTQGVASFEYSAASEKYPLLFELSRPLDDLEEMLSASFSGQKLNTQQIYERHSIGTPYIKRNYKQILAKMESEGKIISDPPASKRPKRKGQVTFADSVVVTFPNRSSR